MKPEHRAGQPVMRLVSTFLLLLAASFPTSASPPERYLVVCSPGSPGNAAQAQPTMDSFARAATLSAGWPEGSLGALYFETAEGGLDRLSRPDAVLALVPPAFLARYGKALGLKPRMEAVMESGRPETWSLAARKGRVASPFSLKGWEITGAPGFAPDFVRAEFREKWGELPAETRISYTPRILTALRRASGGEDVAVLMDSAQTAALSTLPFAGDLEIIWSSKPMPGAILCTVGSRLPAAQADALVRGLAELSNREGGTEVLKSLRLSRFAVLEPGSTGGLLRPRQSAAPGATP
jgi:hypothetical protein